MIVKWLGVVEPNSTNSNYLIIEDFYPTILEMAGILEYQTVQTIDDQSFVHILKNNTKEEQVRPLFWHYPNEWGPSGPGIGAFSAVRKNDWKLIYYHLTQSFELFDLEEDIGETRNLADERPDELGALASILTEYLEEVEAQMPSDKMTGEVVPYPMEHFD